MGNMITVYHDSPEVAPFAITNSGMFGGVFAGYEHGGMYGEYEHTITLDSDDILTHDAFAHLAYARYDEPEHAQFQEALAVLSQYCSDDQIDELWSIVAEETDDQEMAAEIMSMDVMDAGWKLQMIRGEIARRLGYKAVECEDETGTSVLVLDGHTERI